jgi:hypothetical protein
MNQRFLHADRRVVVDRKERLAVEVDVAVLWRSRTRAPVRDGDLGVRREQAVVPPLTVKVLQLTACRAELQRRRQVDRSAAIA